MHATYTPFIYHQRRLKKHLFDELLEMHKKWMLKHCNTGILHQKNAIRIGCKEPNFRCKPRCLKITEKVSFNIASEASYVYILNGQKLSFCRVFENMKLAVKQRYQTGQLK